VKRRDSSNKRGATAAAIVAGLACATALFTAKCNENATVYGPPPTDDSDYKPTANSNECVYGPPSVESFKPDDNQNGDVYGPPPDESFDPADNNNADVYGPPEFFESTNETN